MYARCGSLDEGRNVFENMHLRTVVSWNAIISGYADNGEDEQALELFTRMQRETCEANTRTCLAAIKACSHANSRARGEALHLLIATSNLDSDVYVGNTLVDMYGNLRSMQDAERTFAGIKARDVVSWNALIWGYVENGEGYTALDLISRMRNEGCIADSRTYIAAFKACSFIVSKEEEGLRTRGKALHLLAVQHCHIDKYAKSSLVYMYAKIGSMQDAMDVFVSIKDRDVVSWNALMLGYVDNRDGEMALLLFSRLLGEGSRPDSTTFVSALKACSDLALNGKLSLEKGKAIHLLALYCGKIDMYVKSSLVDMYAKCGAMETAQRVFNNMERHDVVSWTALIVGYADSGEDDEIALYMFSRMWREGCAPNARTFVAALKGVTHLAAKGTLCVTLVKKLGYVLHVLASSSGSDANFYVGCTLIDMYAKLGCMENARKVFENLKHVDMACWTALISGYMGNGEGQAVLELYDQMKREGLEPDSFTLAAALKACTMIGALQCGKAIHNEIRNRSFQGDAYLTTCLVDLYAKCGNMAEAEQVIGLHTNKDLVTWTALMTGYSRLGDSGAVFNIFERMLDSNYMPDRITFVCLLTACSHAGFVDKGKNYFDVMSKYGTHPDLEHYSCMLDILGRANKLADAMALLRSMPFNPDSVTWMTVLGACDKWKNVGVGKLVFESLRSLDHKKGAGPYVLIRNVYRGMQSTGNSSTVT